MFSNVPQSINSASPRNNIEEYNCYSAFPISSELILGCLGERAFPEPLLAKYQILFKLLY